MTELEELVQEINRFEAIVTQWDESQRCVVAGLKRAIETLHKAALTRLIQNLKQESMSALRHAVDDEIVYAVLLYHELVKAPQPSLQERIETALAEIRPHLKSHNGDVELVGIKPPDKVEVRLIGNCSHCPTSTLTLSHTVEQSIKNHCPEISQVIAVSYAPTKGGGNFSSDTDKSVWMKVTTIDKIPESGILTGEIGKNSLILYRQAGNITCYLNSCPHLGHALDKGKLNQLNHGIITCPSHGFQYKLDTGECLTTPSISLHSYPVDIKGEKVFVKIPKYSLNT